MHYVGISKSDTGSRPTILIVGEVATVEGTCLTMARARMIFLCTYGWVNSREQVPRQVDVVAWQKIRLSNKISMKEILVSDHVERTRIKVSTITVPVSFASKKSYLTKIYVGSCKGGC